MLIMLMIGGCLFQISKHLPLKLPIKDAPPPCDSITEYIGWHIVKVLVPVGVYLYNRKKNELRIGPICSGVENFIFVTAECVMK